MTKRYLNCNEMLKNYLHSFQRIAGGEAIGFDNSVFLSEKETADRNYAMAYYMREKKYSLACYTMILNVLNPF